MKRKKPLEVFVSFCLECITENGKIVYEAFCTCYGMDTLKGLSKSNIQQQCKLQFNFIESIER